jgi:protein TonB
MTTSSSRWKKSLPLVLGVVFVAVVVTLAVLFIKQMLAAVPPSKKAVQQVTLLQPPPPPPPPPKVEPPPQPEIEEVKAPEPEPEPAPDAPDAPPPGDNLALDADGGAGGDAFGLLGKKGGRALIGGEGGSAFAWYASRIQTDVQDALEERDDIRRKRYSVRVNMWLATDGTVRKVELVGSSGSAEMDRTLRAALTSLKQVATRPPEDLPQPIRLRIASRL